MGAVVLRPGILQGRSLKDPCRHHFRQRSRQRSRQASLPAGICTTGRVRRQPNVATLRRCGTPVNRHMWHEITWYLALQQ